MSTNRENLKSYFQTGFKPNQSQFEELIFNTVNNIDDKATEAEAQNPSIENKYITPKTAKKAVEKFAPVKKVNGVLPNTTNGEIIVEITDIEGLTDGLTNLQTNINNKQDKLVSATNIKTINGLSILESGNIQISNTVYSTDYFISSQIQGPFEGFSLGTGTFLLGNNEIKHPGIIVIKKSTSANTGYGFSTNTSKGFDLFEGAKCNLIFKTISNNINKTLRFGFLNSFSSTPPQSSVYFELNGLSLKVISGNQNITITPSLTINEWYHLKITIPNLNQVLFEVFDQFETLINSQLITISLISNIKCGFIGFGTAASSNIEELFYVDYMDLNLSSIRTNL